MGSLPNTAETPNTDNSSASSASPSPVSSSSYPAWHNAVAGGVAGAGSRMVTAPLDLIRIRRQLSPRTLYPSESMLDSWLKIVQNEGGVSALFRGNAAAIYLWVGYAAVQFALYNRTKQALLQCNHNNRLPFQPSEYPTTIAFLAGATAGTCATLATYPFDLCRTTFAARGIDSTAKSSPPPPQPPMRTHTIVPFSSLLEPPPLPAAAPTTAAHTPSSSSTPPKTISEFSIQLYRRAGIRGFYAGSGPAVVQIIPYMGLNFALYETFTFHDSQAVGLSAYAGAVSGFISKLCVYPADTTKRRLQIQAFYAQSHDTSDVVFQRYAGMRDCAVQIWRHEGVTGFYRGVVPSVLKTTISTALSFALFRSAKNALEAMHGG